MFCSVASCRIGVSKINIEDAIEHLEDVLENTIFECEECKKEHEQLLVFLKQVPKHGKWIAHPDIGWECSECHVMNRESESNYCPNCGTIMDGE